MRYIHKQGNKYAVRKYFDDKMHYYGYFIDLKDAKFIRDALVSINFGLKEDNKYISKSGRYYRIRKIINGEVVWDCLYKNLEEARNERNLLVKSGWDVDNIGEKSNRVMKIKQGSFYTKPKYRDWFV